MSDQPQKKHIPKTLPETDVGWQKEVTNQLLENKTIHQIKLTSGSKISYEQYLMLRVIWQAKLIDKFNPAEFGLEGFVKEAETILATYNSWKLYKESFTGKLQEGTFALARFDQQQISDVPQDAVFRSNVAVGSPIAYHTRSHTKSLTEGIKKLTFEDPPERPSTPQAPESEHEYDDTPPGQRSYGPAELLDLNYPKTKDEQIVNTALVSFLNAFIIHFDLPVHWTMYRKAFVADFGGGNAFEARTDGCLEDRKTNKVHAIIEVKPMLRMKEPTAIPMQEAAQMAAWIKHHPDPVDSVGGCGRRMHVSQDRNEIWLIFAEYGGDYVRYLNNALGPNEKPGFLVMHQFGPWDIQRLSDMAQLGKILLGIALRARSAT